VKRRVLTVILFLLLGAIINIAVAWACSYFVVPRFVRAESIESSRVWPYRSIPATLKPTQPAARFEGFGVVEHGIMIQEKPNPSANIDPVNGASIGLSERLVMTTDQVTQELDAIYRRVPDGGELGSVRRRARLLEFRRLPNAPPPLRVEAGWPLLSLQGWGPGSTEWRPNRTGAAQPVPQTGEYAIVLHQRDFGSRRPIIRLLPFRPMWIGFVLSTLFYAFILWLLFAAPFALRRWRRIKRGLCPKCAYPVGASDVCTECGATVTRKVEASTSPDVAPLPPGRARG